MEDRRESFTWGITPMETFLDRLHARARAIGPLHRLAIVSRILLALAFIPTGMVKLLGQRFTLMSPDTPIGGFFEAMYQTGFYWNLLGLAQVMAGVLLLVPWTATLGAAGTGHSEPAGIGRLEMAGYVIGTSCGLGVFAAIRGLVPTGTVIPLLIGGVAAGLMVLAAWIREATTRTAA